MIILRMQHMSLAAESRVYFQRWARSWHKPPSFPDFVNIAVYYLTNTTEATFLARLFSKKRRGIVIALASVAAACENFDIF